MIRAATMISKSKLMNGFWIALVLVASVWMVRLYDLFLQPDLNQYGIHPRSWSGLAGVFLSPFLHEGFTHLMSNTVPLFVLLLLLFLTQERPWKALIWIVLLSGLLLWLVGRNSIHIGASTLIFGLITYLIASGIWHRRVVGSIVAAAVLVVYGGSLIWGVMPRINSHVSWEGHLSGAVVGVAVAWLSRRREQNELDRSGFDLGKFASYEPPPIEPSI
jgi:membrane associated rhomboid family serine protease